MTGSAMSACEAGVPAELTVFSKDGFGNARAGADAAAVAVTSSGWGLPHTAQNPKP